MPLQAFFFFASFWMSEEKLVPEVVALINEIINFSSLYKPKIISYSYHQKQSTIYGFKIPANNFPTSQKFSFSCAT